MSLLDLFVVLLACSTTIGQSTSHKFVMSRIGKHCSTDLVLTINTLTCTLTLTYACAHTHTHNTCTHARAHTHSRTHAHIHIHVHTHISARIHTYILKIWKPFFQWYHFHELNESGYCSEQQLTPFVTLCLPSHTNYCIHYMLIDKHLNIEMHNDGGEIQCCDLWRRKLPNICFPIFIIIVQPYLYTWPHKLPLWGCASTNHYNISSFISQTLMVKKTLMIVAKYIQMAHWTELHTLYSAWCSRSRFTVRC